MDTLRKECLRGEFHQIENRPSSTGPLHEKLTRFALKVIRRAISGKVIHHQADDNVLLIGSGPHIK
jgi:hypothetical protein